MTTVYPVYGAIPSIATGSGGTGQTVTIGAGAGALGQVAWSNSSNYTKVAGNLKLDGPDADIIINGVKLSDTLNSINDRLAILQPKTELLEKYANLRTAYEHYKTLEALLHEDDNG
jgi:hypothetical protein